MPYSVQWPWSWHKIHDGFNLIFACQQTDWLMIIHWPCTISYDAKWKRKKRIICIFWCNRIVHQTCNLFTFDWKSRWEYIKWENTNRNCNFTHTHTHFIEKIVSIKYQGNCVRSRAYDIDCINFSGKTIE